MTEKIEVVKIESPSSEDISAIQSILSQSTVRKFLPFKNPPSYTEVEKLVKRFSPEGNHIWKITDNGKLIGIIDLLKSGENRVSMAYILQFEYWGKGIMSRIIEKVVSISFNELEIHYIEASPLSRNVGSQKVLLKNGFVARENSNELLNFDGVEDFAIIFELARTSYN